MLDLPEMISRLAYFKYTDVVNSEPKPSFLSLHASWCSGRDTWQSGIRIMTHELDVKTKERKRKDSAGSDDTARLFKGGGYFGARTTTQTIK